MPPSTGRSTPAIKLASSDARNKAVDAISSGRPSRPNGTDAANWARAWSAPSLVGARWSKIGVSIGPGLIALTRMRRSFQLGRPGADEGADCRLSGAVGGEAGDALVLGDRCDHDDRPAVIYSIVLGHRSSSVRSSASAAAPASRHA